MATYAVGDIQGRYNDLLRLLDRLEFSFEKDRLILLGDLVNRGPDSLGVIRFAMQHPEQVRLILGNHDLFLIGILENILKQRPHDTTFGYSDSTKTAKRFTTGCASNRLRYMTQN